MKKVMFAFLVLVISHSVQAGEGPVVIGEGPILIEELAAYDWCKSEEARSADFEASYKATCRIIELNDSLEEVSNQKVVLKTNTFSCDGEVLGASMVYLPDMYSSVPKKGAMLVFTIKSNEPDGKNTGEDSSAQIKLSPKYKGTFELSVPKVDEGSRVLKCKISKIKK